MQGANSPAFFIVKMYIYIRINVYLHIFLYDRIFGKCGRKNTRREKK